MPKTVLVVDDDDNTRRVLTVALEENGYNAITARDGDEGYRKVEEAIPDLILLDVMMPKKTGFSLFKQLRRKEEYKDIPVIMLTGVAGVLEEEDAQAEGDTFESPFDSLREGLRRGIAKMREEGIIRPDRFIDKPIDPEELIESVRGIIG
ncbi:MAG: response regulator [Gemmatimonadetes bacterium]|nr:response regulator [Gemmatimonadota bacterium]